MPKFYSKPKFVMIRGQWHVFWLGGYARGVTMADAWRGFQPRA